jgi:hypothetical protein
VANGLRSEVNILNHSATLKYFGWFLMFNATFNNFLVILWWSVLLVEETGVPGKSHPPVASI